MRILQKVLYTTFLFVFLCALAFANNPGGHMVQLSWTDTCATGQTCTYPVYRGTATGVCGTGMVPFAVASGFTFEDDTVVAGTTYFYAVTQMPSGGGESNCSVQLQIAVPNSQGTVPGVFQGQGH
ncbi:MAG: hypothetical protein WBD45_05825 [Terriglobales bacterium]